MSFDTDIRVEELSFLLEVERGKNNSRVMLSQKLPPFRDMVIHLVAEGYLNGLEHAHWVYKSGPEGYPVMNPSARIDQAYLDRRFNDLNNLFGNQEVYVQISHKGRLRIAELRQTLKGERQREQFGILLDGRTAERDLGLMIPNVTAAAPVSVGFLDMNGLKLMNDTYGHNTGSEALKVFFQVVGTTVEGNGDAYRIGGDEVLVLLPKLDLAAATALMTTVLKRLGTEQVLAPNGTPIKLRTSCGVVTTTKAEDKATEVIERADKEMYRAKQVSKAGYMGSVLAVDGQPEVKL